MKMSFITKIFSGVIALLFFVFIVQFIFQSFIFPIYFLNEVENNIENNLNSITNNETNYISELHQFTENTQTVSTILSSNDLASINNRLNEITIETEQEFLKINIPMMSRIDINVGDEISGKFVESNLNRYLPLQLYLNDEKVYGGGMKKKTHFFDLDGEEVSISGTVTEIKPLLQLNQEDVTFSQEIVNLQTGNVTNLKEIQTGISYISKNVLGEDMNLVYVTNIDSPNGDLLLTVYSLNNISLISKKLSTFNLVTYISALLILIALSILYIRKVSVPLIKINETTKRLSNLDFTNIEEFHTQDEIGELSRSINILSENLKTALDDLKERNEQLSNSFNREIERDELRKEFVASVSHELKTPLSIIQASSEALSMNMFELDEDRNEQFEVISREITRTNKLIMEMMNVYKIDQKEYKSNWIEFDLKDILLKVNESLSKLAEIKDINITLNISSFYMEGDVNKMELVISNLYSNAIKYTDSNEEIIINLNENEFTIINTGTHIPKDSLNNLFEPFYRVDKSKSRKDGSTGLGLYIVKQILDQHELTYSIENIKKGVKFSIRK